MDHTSLRALRERKGYTQAHLVALAEVDVKTVQRAESGARISGETLMALCSALGTIPDELGGDPAPVKREKDLVVIHEVGAQSDPEVIASYQDSVRDVPGLSVLVINHRQKMGWKDWSIMAGLFMIPFQAPLLYILKQTDVMHLFDADAATWAKINTALLLFVVVPLVYALEKISQRIEANLKGQAYAIGRQTICRLTLRPDAIVREVLRIDTEHAPWKECTGDGIHYRIPIAGSRIEFGPISETVEMERLYQAWPTNRRILPLSTRSEAVEAV
jgi:transcriptional regulator with XRE-family HTH domain